MCDSTAINFVIMRRLCTSMSDVELTEKENLAGKTDVTNRAVLVNDSKDVFRHRNYFV